jgi:phosphoglycolate phosphatase
LFDLDGTLVDTAPDLGLAANRVREDLGMAPLPLDDYRPFASCGARGLLKIALGITPDQAGYDERKEQFLVHYRQNLSTGSRLFDGVDEMLRDLERAHIRWGVVTNKVGSLSGPLMGDLALTPRSACLVSGDSTPNPKPAPDPLLLACQQIGVKPEDCLYVGDDLRDIEAGRAAHMTTIAAAWGYLGQHPDPHAWQADVVIDTPAELMGLIELRRAA